MVDKKDPLMNFLFDDLNYDFTEKVPANERMPITIWVPKEYHAKYERIQAHTGKTFSKKMKEIIKKSIDLVDEKIA